MRRFWLFCLAAAWSFVGSDLASAAEVRASAQYFIQTEDPNDPRTDSQEEVDTVGPVSASVSDPLDKADASASAEYGELGTVAEIDPDIGGNQMTAQGESDFFDVLTITGDNLGATATAEFRLRVQGVIRQPFIVSEVIGYAQVSAEISAGSNLGGDSDSGLYSASGFGSPVINVVNDVLTATVPFTVGETISLGAGLDATAEASGLNVAPSAVKFSALFGNTASLRIVFRHLANPNVTAESGATYNIVPEPSCGVLTMLGALAMLWRRR